MLELRLEAARNPAIAVSIGATLRRNYQVDVAFHHNAGLPGSGYEIALLHVSINGFLLDQLTASIGVEEHTVGAKVDDRVRRLVPGNDAERERILTEH